MASFGAVLDACVLVPVALSDTLLRLAEHELFRPVWSQKILQETRDAILLVHPDMDPSRAEARLHAMDEAFSDASVTGWEAMADGLTMPDPEDRHVVAAAIRGRAELIVTANIGDFPSDILEPLGLHALSPDDFLLDQLDLAPGITKRALEEQAAATRRPPLTVSDVLDALDRAGVPQFAAAARGLF